MSELPYWNRWAGPSKLIALHVPENVQPLNLGADESILLFLADRIPVNRDFTGNRLYSQIFGSHVVFTYEPDPELDWIKSQIVGKNYSLLNSLTGAGGVAIFIYQAP